VGWFGCFFDFIEGICLKKHFFQYEKRIIHGNNLEKSSPFWGLPFAFDMVFSPVSSNQNGVKNDSNKENGLKKKAFLF
jgi:hypothetical protein